MKHSLVIEKDVMGASLHSDMVAGVAGCWHMLAIKQISKDLPSVVR
jgi:hypothetical protein